MDTISIAPALFVLTIFLISVAATIVASIVSQQVLAEQTPAKQSSANRNVEIDARFAQKAEEQAGAREEDGLRKAA